MTTRYELILPPGWVMIPVKDDASAAVDAILDRQFEGLPMDSYGPRKKMLRDGILQMASRARESGGLDAVFPLGAPWAVPVSAGIVLSELTTIGGSDGGGEALLAELARTTPGALETPTDAGVAVRSIEDHPRPDDASVLTELRTVRYTWRVPVSTTLMISTMTISGESTDEYSPIVDGLTDLFDAMMQSLRWREEGEVAT